MTTAPFALSDASSPTRRAILVRLWASAAFVAALSTGIIWEANPGINWLLCIAVASATLLATARAEGTASRAPPRAGVGFAVGYQHRQSVARVSIRRSGNLRWHWRTQPRTIGRASRGASRVAGHRVVNVSHRGDETGGAGNRTAR